ncbi:hypothetical protein LXL04_037517 [Taraxacum kok-saghyz]
MASSSSSTVAASSSSPPAKYQVFLNFRGKDIRPNFLSHLLTALKDQGIHTYIDNEKLECGDTIGPALMTAIEESEAAVTIFSENYADSAWCLKELVHIIKCKNEETLKIVPVFYKVEPHELKHQEEKYGAALAQHDLKHTNDKVQIWGISHPLKWFFAKQELENKQELEKKAKENKAKVESWRKALIAAGNISGLNSEDKAYSDEAAFVKAIVKKVLSKLRPIMSNLDDKLVGIESSMKDLKSKLRIGSGGVRMIGIWGIGGSGKTTLASSIYNEISSEFEACCLLKNIQAESKFGLGRLEKEFLSQMGVHEVGRERFLINNRFRQRMVLVVLDDVDRPTQLEALAGSRDWFGPGSRIIITTTNRQLLDDHNVDEKQEIRLLYGDDAITLFSHHLEGYNMSLEMYNQFLKEVISYAGGLPLALKVLGRVLRNKNATEWRKELNTLKNTQHREIKDVLKISYGDLEPHEKQLFLDIACFFRKVNQNKAMERLDACGVEAHAGVTALIQKGLITISDGKFEMHNLVQDMAHYIVRGEHPHSPEKHTRVWKKEHVLQICAMKATRKLDVIEAIRCKYTLLPCLPPIVANMENARWIDWSGDLASPLPEDFPPRTLRCLTVEGISQKQLWQGDKLLLMLEMLELDGFRNLTMTPNVRGIPKLKRFKLRNCSYLKQVHNSIGCSENLVFISIENCINLNMFPPIDKIKKLETLTFSHCPKLFKLSKIKQQIINHIWPQFYHLRLEKLVLSGCDLGDEHMGFTTWYLPNLKKLDLSQNNFEELDFSHLRIPRLKWLNISNCGRLLELKLPSSIAIVIADDCTSLDTFRDISRCKWLWNFSHLKGNKAQSGNLLHSMLKGKAFEDHYISVALVHDNPGEFVGGLFRANTFTLHLLPDWYQKNSGFLIYIVTDIKNPDVNIIFKNHANDYHPRLDIDVEPELDNDESRTAVGYVAFNKLGGSALSTSSYNSITFSIEDRSSSLNYGGESYLGAALISRRANDPVQETNVQTDCSEFGDEELQNGNAFTIQHDSEPSIKIHWFPFSS